MTVETNESFSKLVEHLKQMGDKAFINPKEDAIYQDFIKAFPADKLRDLTLDEYCVGKNHNSFSWWIERGLEGVLGRYMPGTSRGHMIYWEKDEQLYYKNRKLAHLSDEEALDYVLEVHATIAQANINDDITWVDNKNSLSEHIGREALAMPGPARRLRVLNCYNPETMIPINSPKHIKHFLEQLGYTQKLPSIRFGVKLIELLDKYYELAQKEIPHLTRYGFTLGLYSEELGINPKKSEADEIVDDEDIEEDLLTGRNGMHQSELPLNQILFGPPGTGKTYSTVDKALEILDPDLLEETANSTLTDEEQRKQLKQRFDELSEQGSIRFTTFHQSFSYEDFVEGIRAEVDKKSENLRYEVADGVFKALCTEASAKTDLKFPFQVGQKFGSGYTIQRISLELVEFSKPTESGNLLQLPRQTIERLLACVDKGLITVQDIRSKSVFDKIPDVGLERYIVNGYNSLLASMVELGLENIKTSTASLNEDYVLIIDEINRGNVSRIFGELITLLEPSKRAGASEALSVTLPYSKQSFSVPSNVYLICTMNTADRSLAGLDIALRRRFVFQELMPNLDTLKGVVVAGVNGNVRANVQDMLGVMNKRIEVLLGREYQIGHAYFLPLKAEPTLERLGQIFSKQIIPLLQEYFFDDWQRIGWVLNDHNKARSERFIQQDETSLDELFGKELELPVVKNNRWHINKEAFKQLNSFASISNFKPTSELADESQA